MAFARRAPAAGVYAERRYEAGLRSWQRGIRRGMAFIVGPLLLVSMAILLVEGHVASWAGGALAGFGGGIWAWVRGSPPEYVENWHLGAEGERKTERALEPLVRAGWSFAHDIQGPGGNIDHIAVGPAGVYLLETKNPRGSVEIRKGVTHVRPRHDPDRTTPLRSVRPQAAGAAARTKDEIERRSGIRAWVQPTVVFWSDFPAQLVEDDGCVYVHGSRLASWLRERPETLDQQQVERVAAAIASLASERELEV